MKRFLLFISIVLFYANTMYAVEIDSEELLNSHEVSFMEFTGKYDSETNTSLEIRKVGRRLGQDIWLQDNELKCEEPTAYDNPLNRYSAKRIHSTDKRGADIFIIESNAKVDTTVNLYRILSGYIEYAFHVSLQEADQYAMLVCKYNASHYDDNQYFSERYCTSVLNSFNKLCDRHIGVSSTYSNWPGKTKIVIPFVLISKTTISGSAKDQQALSNQIENDDKGRVVQKLKTWPNLSAIFINILKIIVLLLLIVLVVLIVYFCIKNSRNIPDIQGIPGINKNKISIENVKILGENAKLAIPTKENIKKELEQYKVKGIPFFESTGPDFSKVTIYNMGAVQVGFPCRNKSVNFEQVALERLYTEGRISLQDKNLACDLLKKEFLNKANKMKNIEDGKLGMNKIYKNAGLINLHKELNEFWKRPEIKKATVHEARDGSMYLINRSLHNYYRHAPYGLTAFLKQNDKLYL